MVLARRALREDSSAVAELVDLLRAVARGELTNLALTNGKGETLHSILGAKSVEGIEQQLASIGKRRWPFGPMFGPPVFGS